jgi:hypothetical protein
MQTVFGFERLKSRDTWNALPFIDLASNCQQHNKYDCHKHRIITEAPMYDARQRRVTKPRSLKITLCMVIINWFNSSSKVFVNFIKGTNVKPVIPRAVFCSAGPFQNQFLS